MCVVALTLNSDPKWWLVLAGNRDEYHQRPAQPMHRWADASHVIAGRDAQAGGSWLGVSEKGRLAVVTNIRNPDAPDPAKASRGQLVSDWVIEGRAPDLPGLSGYNPFNLLLLDADRADLYSNLPEPERRSLKPGMHGLSNGHPGEPWPRRSAMEAALAAWLRADTSPDELFALLRDERMADDQGLPIFIRAPVYGTRCSTVVLIGRDGRGRIIERLFHPNGSDAGETSLEFAWPLLPTVT